MFVSVLVTKSCSILLQTHQLQPARLFCLWDFPGKNAEVGCHFFLQWVLLAQGSNLYLLHWLVDSLPLRHLESPVVLSLWYLLVVPMNCRNPQFWTTLYFYAGRPESELNSRWVFISEGSKSEDSSGIKDYSKITKMQTTKKSFAVFKVGYLFCLCGSGAL